MVEFSYPFQIIHFRFATKKNKYRPESTAYLRPFSLEVWILILVCLATIPLALSVLLKNAYSFQNYIWIVYVMFIGQAIRIKPKKIRDYLMLICWIVAFAILGYSYKALLLSFLTVPPIKNINNIQELADAITKGRYQCTSFSGSFIAGVLAKSTEPNIRIIGENLQKNIASNDIFAAFSNVKSGRNLAFITGDDLLNPLKVKFFVSDDEFIPACIAVPTRKDFCYKTKLDRLMVDVWASGLFDKLISDEVFMVILKNSFYTSDSLFKHEERQLSVDDFKGAFIVLLIGYLLSTIIFICEVIAYKLKM